MKPLHSFVVTANLPARIAKLKELAYNYWWCWNSDARELFIRINRNLWEEVNHNPVLLINKTPQEQLKKLAESQDYVSFLDYIHGKFLAYMNGDTYYKSKHISTDGVIAYFSMEYGINESLPNYSGGLGVLAGDHLKSASDLGLPLVGVGLLYQQGYFRQRITQNGWQNEQYIYNDFFSLPLTIVRQENGEPLKVSVRLPKGEVFAQIWKINIGRINLYMLDANIDDNKIQEYKDITDQLYGGDRETRIQQEIVLGIGGMRALEAMGIKVEVLHINEGHAAFALWERTRQLMKKHNLDFRSAKTLCKESSVFTTHTPVPAGNETFELFRIENNLLYYKDEFGISREELLEMGQIGAFNSDNNFSMTVLGLKMTSYHNGVSKLHGSVARKMWHSLYQCFPVNEVPIRGITNGVHTQTWIAREFAELFDRYLSPIWRSETDNDEIWKMVQTIPSEEIWREKQRRRVRLILFARNYLNTKQKHSLPPDQVSKINELLNPDTLTIGFARRFATYKRALLLFKNMDRLKKILTNPEHPVQVIISGKAHPHDIQGKEVIQQIIQRVRQWGLEKHVVFLEDYDMVIARMLVKGCDVWLNNPIRPLEASGTSGMKAAINGTLNFSILDGWWDEGFNSQNGFAIGTGEEHDNSPEMENIEAEMLYDMLETVIVPMFYKRGANRVPEEWVQYMKNSIASIAGRFSTHRMVRDYADEFYFPAAQKYRTLAENNAYEARQFQIWKDRIRNQWQYVDILQVDFEQKRDYYVGRKIPVSVKVKLGDLHPDEVSVQVYYGSIDHHGEFQNAVSEELLYIKTDGDIHYFSGSYLCPDTGMQGFTVRVLPKHKYLVHPAEMYLCKWADLHK